MFGLGLDPINPGLDGGKAGYVKTPFMCDMGVGEEAEDNLYFPLLHIALSWEV